MDGIFLFLNFLPVLLGGLFGLVIAVLVIFAVLDGIGQVLLLDPMVGEIVGVQIPLLPFHGVAIRMDILQVPGEVAGFALANIRQSRV